MQARQIGALPLAEGIAVCAVCIRSVRQHVRKTEQAHIVVFLCVRRSQDVDRQDLQAGDKGPRPAVQLPLCERITRDIGDAAVAALRVKADEVAELVEDQAAALLAVLRIGVLFHRL